MHNLISCRCFSKTEPCGLHSVISLNCTIRMASTIEIIVGQACSTTWSFASGRRQVLTFKHVLVVEQLLLKVTLSFHSLYLPVIESVDLINSDLFEILLLGCEVIVLLIFHVFEFIFPRAP